MGKTAREDAIRRQAVLDLAKKGVLVSNGNYKSVCKAINELPPVNPQKSNWIPVSERLPEDGRPVLIYAWNVHHVIARYDEFRTANGYKKIWVTADAWNGNTEINHEVIAWMPLPEPYKAESEKQGMSECNLHDANGNECEWKTIPYDCGVLGRYEMSVSVSHRGMWVEFGPENHDPILSERFNIKYCPWCGKKLKENEE